MTKKRFNKLRKAMLTEMYISCKSDYETNPNCTITKKDLKKMSANLYFNQAPPAVKDGRRSYQECWDGFRDALKKTGLKVLEIER